jgi:hypothetical protein
MTSFGEDSDAEVARLIESGAPGVMAAMQVLEDAEKVYFGAIVATTMPEVVCESAITPQADSGESL